MSKNVLVIIIVFFVGIGVGTLGTQVAMNNAKSDLDPVALFQEVQQLRKENNELKGKSSENYYNPSVIKVERSSHKRRKLPEGAGVQPEVMKGREIKLDYNY